jgi:hypothetical protein
MIIGKVSRLYSIPDTHASGCLVTPETGCGLISDSTVKVNKEVMPMVRFMNGAKKFVSKYSFIVVLIMSIAHLGIAYIHSRESGRVD